jgi:hypothetical protein
MENLGAYPSSHLLVIGHVCFSVSKRLMVGRGEGEGGGEERRKPEIGR